MTAGREISRRNAAPRLAGGAAAAAHWFKAVMWVGIVANVVVALISIVWTEAVLNFLDLEIAQPLVWPRFACVLLILLSIFYVPSAVDPLVHRYSAVVAVICRFAGVAFFTIVGGRYFVFGLFDLTFGLPQAVLLLLAWKSSRAVGIAR